jgi:hypothetical protein
MPTYKWDFPGLARQPYAYQWFMALGVARRSTELTWPRLLSKKKGEDFVKGRKDNPPDGKYIILSKAYLPRTTPRTIFRQLFEPLGR